MKLGLNTFCYEVAGWPVERQIQSAARLGFRNVEYAAYTFGNPSGWAAGRRRDVAGMFKDAGLYCSQMLLTNVEHFASSDAALRRNALDYMKRVTEFQLELGGRQVLVCWGCGVLERGCLPEQSWATMVSSLREYAAWALPSGILIDLELDPHVYFIVNSTVKMAKVIEDVGMENVHPNVDIGHLEITRESPACLEKLRGRIIHVHLSETDTYAHTNSILGEGKADFRAYIDAVTALGIEENCARLHEPCVAGIEMGEPGGHVDDPERWVSRSLEHLARVLPELTR
jgi:sugar phosphate isomerase/epimerase